MEKDCVKDCRFIAELDLHIECVCLNCIGEVKNTPCKCSTCDMTPIKKLIKEYKGEW